MISKEDIDRARSVRIEKILGIDIATRRTCINCPIHGERTPSFYIYPDGSYHCFGKCSKGGQNAIDFLIELGASFKEAVEELQKYA